MSNGLPTNSVNWLQHPKWFFIGSSSFAALVTLVAEGPDSYSGLAILVFCVGLIFTWSLTGTPSLYWTVVLLSLALLILGWTVREPESTLFQLIVVTTAVGWRIDKLSHSLSLLILLAIVPPLGSAWQSESQWGWWNWSVGTAFTWTLGRVIRLLDLTINELHLVRSKLIDSAAKEERLRISRDVHDLVGHSLTVILLNIRAAQRSIDTNTNEAKEALEDAHQAGVSGISNIRAVLLNIRSDPPMGENDSDVLSSLPNGESVMKLLESQEQIKVTTNGNVTGLDGPLAVALYRIILECITNISKYGLAGTGNIALVVREAEISFTAENEVAHADDLHTSVAENTLGLIGMRERVTSLSGSFKAGMEGKNWKVSCTIPRYG